MFNIPEFQKYYQCDCQRYEWKSISHHVYNIRIIPTWFNWNIGLIHCTIAIVGFLGPCSIRQTFSWSIFYFIWLSHNTSRRNIWKENNARLNLISLTITTRSLWNVHSCFVEKPWKNSCCKRMFVFDSASIIFIVNTWISDYRIKNLFLFFGITIFIMFWVIKCIRVILYE